MNKLDELTSQGRRLFSIPDRLDADREFKLWDDDVGKWLAERFPDTSLSANWSSLGSSNLVWDNSVGSSQDEWMEFRGVVRGRLKWLSEVPAISRRKGVDIKNDMAGNIDEMSLTKKKHNNSENTERSPTPNPSLELPAEVTLAWLWEHVPVRFWRWCIALLVAIFLFGIFVGQISWVRELYDGKSAHFVPRQEINTTGEPTRVALSEGEIDLPGPGFYSVDTEGGAPFGDLKRINGLKRGDQAIIAAASSERIIVVKKSPYLKISIDFILNNLNDRIVFVCDGMNKCSEISRSSND